MRFASILVPAASRIGEVVFYVVVLGLGAMTWQDRDWSKLWWQHGVVALADVEMVIYCVTASGY